ncbi:MAG TPA: hypothetical protein VF026_24600 [Ktedonobacteraceae bacterium]
MPGSSLFPVLALEVPDLASSAWIDVVRKALTRAREIEDQRMNYPAITDQHHDDWDLLHRFEYQHFYSAWVAVAFRLRACATHAQDYTALFQRTRGTSQDEDLFREDDALFGFFVKGLSALESFAYSLYALGALICTPAQTPSVPPPAQFPLLHPKQPRLLRNISPAETLRAFERVFPGSRLTSLLSHLLSDEAYRQWSEIRNVLAHRVATAGRSIQYRGPLLFAPDESPLAVTQWAGLLHLDEETTSSRYGWLKEIINQGIEATAAIAAEQLVYTEDQLPRLP